MQSSSLKKAIWFTGSIEEAVKAVTENNLILLVYIFDESEKSKKFNIVFEDGNLVSAIESKAIALKLQKDSHEANLFGQLYPINHVPLVYFILQGTIKDFGIEGLSSQDIISKINNLSPPTTTKDIKEKLKEIKEKHIEKEEKQLKEREMKRREEGKIAQETLQDLKEKQEKTYFEKLKKERKAEEEYKKKIKEQIAKDRADQIAARKAEKQRISIEKEKNMNHNTSSDYYSHCNLNIKQLNGSNLRHSFSPSNRLSEVIEWIDIASIYNNHDKVKQNM
ncbi:uncharacterized protein BX663DRAFT_491769 [Cokeromyces recurvatus]|uniref:uncharacterized protein n=1 Tax=Cokeromyces recurvatus TaxID=90255 RepID=UPI00221EF4E2|nr:uncharacterized protein BX663DRAFT_491769 [Cokeromyces recurvatus]KAI7907700.1 hypothetical protein BX663DRAFT_491769 [Cokeromyces recurvatus]